MRDSYGRTPLIWAIRNGQETIVKLLVDTAKAEMDLRSGTGKLILINAACRRCTTLTELLLYAGKATVNSNDEDGMTLLSWVVANLTHYYMERLLVKVLEADDVEVNLEDGRGLTPLTSAAMGGNPNIVRLFLDSDRVDINLRDGRGQTALSCAAMHGHKDVVKMLIESGRVEPQPEMEELLGEEKDEIGSKDEA